VYGRLGPVADGVDAIVAQWARERPDLDTSAMEIFGRVYRIARISGEAMSRCYARYGLSRADFDVLATLRRTGAPYRLSPSQLTATMMVTSGGMTGRLDRLERAGHVTRDPDPADRRGLLVTLTDSARAVIDEAVAAGLAVQQELLGELPVATRRRTNAVLRELLASVEKHGGS
jgi:DNA-binding MarR family transcriptional regulator